MARVTSRTAVVVIDQQYGRVARSGNLAGQCRLKNLVDALRVCARQIDVDRCATAWSRFDTHAAARLFGKTKHLAQAKPRALAHLLGSEERIEYFGADFVAHAAAVVRDAH
jgi:hypothetical protein